MSTVSISSPFPIFTDIDGQPLENGYIFIGIANLGPIGNPINVYWDAALTIPAAQPIRTLGGYPINNGTPARLYVSSQYSIQVQNRNGSVVYSAPVDTEFMSSANISYLPAGTGAVATTVQAKLRESVSVKDFGANTTPGTTDMTSILFAAITAATTAQADLIVPAGTYKLSGANTFNIDIGKMSLIAQGTVVFDCSAMTATNAVQIYSSLGYPASHYTNTVNKLAGIVFKGGSTAGRHGLLVGHVSNANNGQSVIEACSFVNFDRNIHFMTNAWRTVFRDCVSMTALNYTLYWPSGLTNAGEAMSFYHCQFNDGTGKIQCDADGQQIHMYSCSILNQPVVITGTSVMMTMFGGNMENPANATPYTYVTVSGLNSVFVMNGNSLVVNSDATFTDAIFNISNVQSSMIFNNIVWPDGAHLQFETTVGWRTFAKGVGRVVLNGNSFWPASGGYKCPVSVTANGLNNGNFELGNTTGWTVAAYGTGGSTAVASATAKKNGTYGLLVTTVAGGGINITQKANVKPGQLVQTFAWIRVATAGAAPVGYFQYKFSDALGNQISNGGDEIISTSWTKYGSSQTVYAPVGADTVEIIINGQVGGPNLIYVDDVIVNIN